MKRLKNFIINLMMPSEVIFEMTTIDKHVKFSKNTYKIALHGPAKCDRENLHIQKSKSR